MKLAEVEYGGMIFHGDRAFRYRKAEKRDIPALAGMYRQIAVTEENLKEKLDRGNPGSFQNTGGMFLIMTEPELETELEKGSTFWAVFEDEAGKIASSFWFSDENHLLGEAGTKEGWPEEMKGKIAYPREIIVAPGHKGQKLGKLAYGTILAALSDCGYVYSLCDVYRVTAYEIFNQKKRGEIKQVSLLNYPSFLDLIQIGGQYLGAGEVREIRPAGYRVWIEPQIFWVEHERARLFSTSIFLNSKVCIREDKKWGRRNKAK